VRHCEQPDQTWHFNPAPGGAGRAPEIFEILFRSQEALELLSVVPKTEADVKADPEENKDRAIKGEEGAVKHEPAEIKTEIVTVKTERAAVKTEATKVKTEPTRVKTEPAKVKIEPANVKSEPAPVEPKRTKAMGKRKREDPVVIENAPAPTKVKREHRDAASQPSHHIDDDEVQFIMAFPVRRRQVPASGQTVIDLDSE
jgi:hypothetical protein